MKRIVTIGDTHGNYYALEACVNDAINTYKDTIDGFVFMGDYAGDFCNGKECIDLILALKEKYNVFAIRGNRENMIDTYCNQIENDGKCSWDINSTMGAPLIDFRRMDKKEFDFVKGLEETIVLDFNDAPSILLKHKMPLNENEQQFIKENNINYILSAHTHEQHEGTYEGIKMFNSGSCGLCDDGKPGANYAILENKNNDWLFVPKKIDYDYNKTIESIRENDDLCTKCKGWGTLLIDSVKTGINITSLYMFELKRLNRIYHGNNQDNNPDLYMPQANFLEAFGQGRYGNLNPFGKNLEIPVFAGNENGELAIEKDKVKTDENTTKSSYDNSSIPDFLYPIAYENVQEYMRKANQLENNEYDASLNVTIGRKSR